jgi:hypothetical protein
VADDLDERVRKLETRRAADDLRLQVLEQWRRRDEPRVAELATAAQVAAEVRKALTDRGRHEWTLWQKAAAAVSGIVVLAGEVASLMHGFHW